LKIIEVSINLFFWRGGSSLSPWCRAFEVYFAAAATMAAIEEKSLARDSSRIAITFLLSM